MRKASWILTFLFGSVLVLSAPQARDAGGAHVSTRYDQKAQVETGQAKVSSAIAWDYRSFDAVVLCLLLFCGSLACLSPSLLQVPGRPLRARTWGSLFLSGAGLILALSLGAYCVLNGSNFLDFEPLVRFFSPERARPGGALLLVGALGVSVLASLLAFFDKRSKAEEPHGR